VFAGLGTFAGVLVAVLSSTPQNSAAVGPPIAAASFGLSTTKPSASNTPVISGVPLTIGAGIRLLAGSSVPAVQAAVMRHVRVAPLHRTVQADLLVVGQTTLPAALFGAITKLPGMIDVERIEAVRLRVNGSSTAVVGANPSEFRSFAARPTGAANALWQGVADGGIAVSYSMGQLDKIPLGGYVSAAGTVTKKLKVTAFGTLGIGGVNAVVSDQTAEQLGAPARNAIVISVRTEDFTADAAAIGRLLPKGAGVEQLVSLVTEGGSTGTSTGIAGAGSATAASVPVTAVDAMLRAAMSRRGLPYIWGAAGPTSFDCSGLVQWSFAQAGITMPRVAADQALAGPAVPVSRLQPGDLLFYHTDPTAPNYISHVAIYLGNGWMIQAPEPGRDVEVVPAGFGAEFAGAIRVSPAQAASVAAGLA